MAKRLVRMSLWLLVLSPFGCPVVYGEGPVTWNDSAPQLLHPTTVQRLTEVGLGPIAFPTAGERQAAVKAPEQAVNAYVEWLNRIIADQWLPADVGAHAIALRRWAHGRDTFVVRYTLNGVMFQLIDNRSETTVIIRELARQVPASRAGRSEFVLLTASKYLTLPKAISFRARQDERDPDLRIGHWAVRPWRIADPATATPRARIMFATDGLSVLFSMVKQYGPATPRPPSVIDKPLFDEEPPPKPAPTPQPKPKPTPKPVEPGPSGGG